MSITLESDGLTISVTPQVGGTITGVRHRQSGLSVLGRVPWAPVNAPLPSLAARDEPEWLTRYTGGWPLLFPNAGDSCLDGDVFHGFHGEASIAPWDAVATPRAITLERRFSIIPAFMRRRISVEGDVLTVQESLAYSGADPMEVMWGHHPSFGSDLLAGPFEITCGAADVTVEAQYDPPANPLLPGAAGHWPQVAGKQGVADLRHPSSPWSSVAYLENFQSHWAAIRRLDDAIAIMLSWDGARFPVAWAWYELDGTAEAPWSGRTRLIGIEPNTTPCALCLAESRRRNAALLRLEPGCEISAEIRLHVFKPAGPILQDTGGLGIEPTPSNEARPS